MQSLSYSDGFSHACQNIKLLFGSPRLFAIWTLARLASFLWMITLGVLAALPFALLIGYGGYTLVTSGDYQDLYTLIEANISDPESLFGNPAFESGIAAILAQWIAPLVYAFIGLCGLVLVLPFISTYGSFLMQALSYRIIREKQDFNIAHWKALAWGPVFWRTMHTTWHYLWRVSIPLLAVLMLVVIASFVIGFSGVVPSQDILTLLVIVFSALFIAAIVWTVRMAYMYLFAGIYALVDKHDHHAALMSSREMTRHRLWKLFLLVLTATLLLYIMQGFVRSGIDYLLPDWRIATSESLLVNASYSAVGAIQTLVLWLIFGNMRDFIVASLYDHLAHKHFFHI